MRFCLSLGLFLFSTVLFAENYGEKFSGKANKLNIASLGDHYQANKSKVVFLEAKVEKVCEKKGCWMRLRDESGSVRVSFKGYSFFVPMSLEGRTVRAEGIVKLIERSVKDQKHFLADEKASQEKIDAVKEPQTSYEFEAYAVSTDK